MFLLNRKNFCKVIASCIVQKVKNVLTFIEKVGIIKAYRHVITEEWRHRLPLFNMFNNIIVLITKYFLAKKSFSIKVKK